MTGKQNPRIAGEVPIDPDEDPNDTRSFASPPCFMHEVDPAYFGLDPEPQRSRCENVRIWRRNVRRRLTRLREALPLEERRVRSERIAGNLDRLLDRETHAAIGAYWSIRGEPNLIGWMRRLVERGHRVVLPVVLEREHPMQFREWTPGCRMAPGIWNIPIPVDGEAITPTMVVAPLVGFDARQYRLGNGGGYYDRTLAVLDPWPLVVGVGYSETALPTIHPQPHDIPMDLIVTEQGELGDADRAE